MSRIDFASMLAVIGGLAVIGMALGWMDVSAHQPAPTEAPTGEPPAKAELAPNEFLIRVESADVRVAESFPVQVYLEVRGMIGDGCTSFDRVEQSRDGNNVSVRIIGATTGGPMCTRIAKLYHDTIVLSGPFGPGSYAVDVNGLAQQFTVS
jgi:hypothetical protein